ncbi:MAG: hypothetical protein RIC15_12635 [Vicingaceae bacterium]
MKTLRNRLLVLIVALAFALGLMFTVELPRYYHYYYTLNDGCNITWIHDRIFENPRAIDIAFLGTSHTGCAVNDGYLDSLIGDENVVNLSYCQGGRNIQFTVLKDILLKHKPSAIYLEVRMEEDFTSHRDFGTVGYLNDVFHAPILANKKYPVDVYKAFLVRYMYFQDRLMGVLPEPPKQMRYIDYSNLPIFKSKAKSDELQAHLKKELDKKEKFKKSIARDWRLKLPRFYLDQIANLCKRHDVELRFLYIPSFGMASEVPFNQQFYIASGKLLIPPRKFFENPDLWMDTEHFNAHGSRLFSTWLATQIEQ